MLNKTILEKTIDMILSSSQYKSYVKKQYEYRVKRDDPDFYLRKLLVSIDKREAYKVKKNEYYRLHNAEKRRIIKEGNIMLISTFAEKIAELEGKKEQVNIAQIKEIMAVINRLTYGVLYAVIRLMGTSAKR